MGRVSVGIDLFTCHDKTGKSGNEGEWNGLCGGGGR